MQKIERSLTVDIFFSLLESDQVFFYGEQGSKPRIEPNSNGSVSAAVSSRGLGCLHKCTPGQGPPARAAAATPNKCLLRNVTAQRASICFHLSC